MKIGTNFSNFIDRIKAREIMRYQGVQTKIAPPVNHDTFEKQEQKETIKKTVIQDKNGNPINAEIRKTTKGTYRKYNLYVGEKSVGYAITTGSDCEKGLYLSDLYTTPHQDRKYKGIGTELLKCMVEESRERGFGGKIYCEACNVPPPYAFYYKNNFQVSCAANSMYNAIIDYAVRNDIPTEKALVRWGAIEMKLDEKGANALMDDKREYEERKVINLGKNENLEAMLIESKNENENYLLIVDKSAKEKQAKYTACLNKEGKMIFVSDIYDRTTNEDEEIFRDSMFKKALELSGADNFYIENH